MSKKPLKPTDTKKRRNIIFASVVAVAVVAVAIVIVVGSGGSDDKSSATNAGGTVQGKQEVSEMLDGIQQKGNTIGKDDAPVTVREFIDYQCPFCKEFSLNVYPKLIQDYVRTGKARWEIHPLSFIGPDSVVAAQAGSAAAQQNLQGTFTDLFYFNQGEENSGYVTDAFLDKLFRASGMDVAKANEFRKTTASKAQTAAASKQAEEFGVNSTPSFVLGKTGSSNFQKIDVSIDSAAGLEAAIDQLLK